LSVKLYWPLLFANELCGLKLFCQKIPAFTVCCPATLEMVPDQSRVVLKL